MATSRLFLNFKGFWQHSDSLGLGSVISKRCLSISQIQNSFHPHLQTPSGFDGRKKVTISTLNRLYKKGEPISAITAHDYPSGCVADTAGIEIILVGDSLAMVSMGLEDTCEITLDEMILHCRSVSRAAEYAFTVGDLPMGSYEISPNQALNSAIRMIKEGRVKAVKLEGGLEMVSTIKKITRAGIPVLGHIGLAPQKQNCLGGFRVQGKTSDSAYKLLQDALGLQDAGCFATVIEAVPAEVATRITKKISIPTIGIGAGNGCSGQVIVQADITNNFAPGRHTPKFVKKYCDVWTETLKGINAFREESKSRKYPAEEHSYPISKEELIAFEEMLIEKTK